MESKRLTLTIMLSAVTIVVAYARGFGLASFPGLVEFMSVMIFVSGFCFGWAVGGFVGALALAIYMLIPYPYAHPAAWLFTISPVLLMVMTALGAMYGLVGGIIGKLENSPKLGTRFVAEMAFWGFALTFIYDVCSSIGFYLAYPVYSSVYDAIYLTFIPAYYPYPPIIHTVTNTFVFMLLAPTLIHSLRHFKSP